MCRSSALFIFIFVIGLTLHAQTRIDGDWWKGISPEMRRGAVSGALDCLVSDHGAKLPTFKVPVMDEKVDAGFAQNPAGTTLADILLALPKKSPPPSPGGEDYSKEKHGWFDGYYWGSASDDERYGFLVGYLSCGNGLTASTARVKEYRDQIDSWYEKHPSSNAKIADVIARVRQHTPKSTRPGNK